MSEIEVKWIKITTDMFDNKKIKHLRKLPDGDKVVLIWVMLLTMAGRCNAGGMIFLTENIPYTPKLLADELDFEENTVAMALKALSDFNMIVYDNDFFYIAGWEEYQNHAKLEEIREYNRIAKQKSREKQRGEQSKALNVLDMSRQVLDGQALDIDIDKKEIYKEKVDKSNSFDLEDAFNKIYEMYPKKGNMVSARNKFLEKFIGCPQENFKDIAASFWYGIKAYLDDYEKSHNDSFKFVPRLDKFLAEDLEYWVHKARTEKESE